MADLLLKDVPKELQARLEQEASAHFRTPDQEAMARLQHSFEMEVNTARDQRWIDEALASGPAEPKSPADWDALKERALGNRRK